MYIYIYVYIYIDIVGFNNYPVFIFPSWSPCEESAEFPSVPIKLPFCRSDEGI